MVLNVIKTEATANIRIVTIGNMANFVYVRQKGPYGNGTPLLNVEHLIKDEPFIYTWSDDFIAASPSRFKQLIAAYQEYESPILASVRATSDDDYKRYGFAGGKELAPGVIEVSSIKEKPGKENAPSNLATVSGFVFTPNIFSYLHKALEKRGDNSELYYNDALKLMLDDNKRIIAYEVQNGRYYDAGNKLEYLKTVVDFALKNPELGKEFKDHLLTLLKP
jgi:UTP--glucose-1-phosphate uridylyltransferase